MEQVAKKGCPCACHGTLTIYHAFPCHTPLLEPNDPGLPMALLIDAFTPQPEPSKEQPND